MVIEASRDPPRQATTKPFPEANWNCIGRSHVLLREKRDIGRSSARRTPEHLRGAATRIRKRTYSCLRKAELESCQILPHNHSVLRGGGGPLVPSRQKRQHAPSLREPMPQQVRFPLTKFSKFENEVLYEGIP